MLYFDIVGLGKSGYFDECCILDVVYLDIVHLVGESTFILYNSCFTFWAFLGILLQPNHARQIYWVDLLGPMCIELTVIVSIGCSTRM